MGGWRAAVYLLERGEGELLDLWHVLRLDTLEPNREGRLLELIRDPPSHDGSPEAGLDDWLVQGGGGGAHQQVVEHAEREFVLGGELPRHTQGVEGEEERRRWW